MQTRITLEQVLENAKKDIRRKKDNPSESLKTALTYINNEKANINECCKPTYHLTGEVGWINDPNGFSYYNDEYHLFYQYHPYDTKWGPMHWGHAVTKDFIKWKQWPVAIAPDKFYDQEGCFSGTGLQVEDLHVLMYTGNTNKESEGLSTTYQVQCIAVGDGNTYSKLESNPVIRINELPSQCSISDFRDPKIWKKDNLFYAAIANKYTDGRGQILLYRSDNLLNWDYRGVLLRNEMQIGDMWECPDIFELDGKDILLISPQDMIKEEYRFHNNDGTIYMIGNLDYKQGKYDYNSYDEIDYGLDFYAPQTLETLDGRRIMIAWMQAWKRNIPSDKLGWTGAMILPRELKIKEGKLIQLPVKEIEQYRKNEMVYKQVKVQGKVELDEIKGRQVELQIEVDVKSAASFEIQLMKGEQTSTKAIYDVARQILIFDRTESQSGINGLNIRAMPVKLYDNKVTLRIFIDTFSIEIFANDGEGTMSSTVYTEIGKDNILFISNDLVVMDIIKWDLLSI